MANIKSKVPTSTPLKLEKVFYGAQILLRTLVAIVTLTGMWVIYGIGMHDRYIYSSAFMFSAIANTIACVFTVLSLFHFMILGCRASNPDYYFFLFLHDLNMTVLVLAGCAATAIGLLSRNGNSHAGWMPICDEFEKFCNRVTTFLILSYFSSFLLTILTILSANCYRQVHV